MRARDASEPIDNPRQVLVRLDTTAIDAKEGDDAVQERSLAGVLVSIAAETRRQKEAGGRQGVEADHGLHADSQLNTATRASVPVTIVHL